MNSDCEHIHLSLEERVLTIRMHRPDKKNALTFAMYTAMAKAIRDGLENNDVRVIMLAGLPDCFSSGNDVMDFMQNPPNDFDTPVAHFLTALATAHKPVLAAVNGSAVGIGTTMLLHCDMVIAGTSAGFQMPFVNLALCPEGASSYLVPQLMGHQRAAELLLVGETFDTAKALELGLVNYQVDDSDTEAEARRWAAKIVAQPPESVQIAKRLMKEPHRENIEKALKGEGKLFFERLTSAETAEAITAFIEKRAPDFSRF